MNNGCQYDPEEEWTVWNYLLALLVLIGGYVRVIYHWIGKLPKERIDK